MFYFNLLKTYNKKLIHVKMK